MFRRGGTLSGIDPRIVEYLRKHKGKHDIDLLKKELVRQGHPHEAVEAAELLSEEDEHFFEPVTPFPDPVFNEIRKEAVDWKKLKKLEKEQIKTIDKLDKIQLFLIILVFVILGAFIYVLMA